MNFSLSRDPAIWLTAFATTVRLVAAFWIDLSGEQQAVLNAVATALASFIVAVMVRKEGQVPALLGVVQAIIALAVGFGAHLSAEQQAIIMSVIGGVVAAFVRTQVVAAKTIDGDPAPRQPIGA
jgi:hypothetical protein